MPITILNKQNSNSVLIYSIVQAAEEVFNLKKIEYQNLSEIRFSIYSDAKSLNHVYADEFEFKRVLSNLFNKFINYFYNNISDTNLRP